jgi:NTP pyrophosphatase (non-canonical NTP hydrolase)
MTQEEILERIEKEKTDAHDRYGEFTSAHEGYGVLAEEMAELLDAIRSNTDVVVQIEACQVAAVATRIATSLTVESTLRRSGMC